MIFLPNKMAKIKNCYPKVNSNTTGRNINWHKLSGKYFDNMYQDPH